MKSRKKWKSLYSLDAKRFGRSGILKDHGLRFLWLLRRRSCSSGPIWKMLLHRMTIKYGLEISPAASIGGGLYLGHPYNINVNPGVTIGSNCNLHKGVTIGAENRGKRKGCPTIGDCVWIGVNATVVGNVTIGDDVLIAPGAYVNCDVPSHSVVLGNPCKITPRDNATEGYINYRIEM